MNDHFCSVISRNLQKDAKSENSFLMGECCGLSSLHFQRFIRTEISGGKQVFSTSSAPLQARIPCNTLVAGFSEEFDEEGWKIRLPAFLTSL
ncbi:MAG: hypothetical protein NTV80_07520 [Verrucomicrobia bacterium]|nr:hypothetical protein [Verrucomicrobiota bacterium]